MSGLLVPRAVVCGPTRRGAVVAAEIPDRVLGRLDDPLRRALDLLLGATLLSAFEELGQALAARLGKVETIDRLSEAQVRLDAGHHDPGVDRQELDAHKGHANERVDHEALVQDGVDDLGETGALWPVQETTSGAAA